VALETTGQSIRLDGEVAAELMRAADLLPLQSYPGANEPWPCRLSRQVMPGR
jgi:hypothetical protein